jgi:hypothetical protein
MARAKGKPRFREPQALIEIRHGVQLDWASLPGGLDLPTQLRREPGRLSRVTRDDVIVEMLQRAHIRDPRIGCNRTASQVPSSTRKAGSRRELDPIDF